MKICFKCGDAKPLTAFYRHPQMADGHLNKCKECTKRDVRAYWAEHGDTLREIEATRRKMSRRAAVTLNNAIRDKRCSKAEACFYCECPGPLEAHHWNYYRPLDVTWICKRCHRIADSARRDAEIKVAVYKDEGF